MCSGSCQCDRDQEQPQQDEDGPREQLLYGRSYVMEHQFDIMDQEPCEMYREKLFLTPSLASTGGCSTSLKE